MLLLEGTIHGRSLRGFGLWSLNRLSFAANLARLLFGNFTVPQLVSWISELPRQCLRLQLYFSSVKCSWRSASFSARVRSWSFSSTTWTRGQGGKSWQRQRLRHSIAQIPDRDVADLVRVVVAELRLEALQLEPVE